MKRAFYNENDPKTAAWLREIIKAGLIAPGDVDERSIIEIKPHELIGYTQCHFFAGIGGWSYALRLAGISDETSIWTGSCPCQPLSCSGQRKGHADERHLWPAFYRLIAECHPAIVFGEQVASPDGREWLAGVRADLEGTGYAVGCADLCAASVGAPHPRQRLYWMAYARHERARRTARPIEAQGRRTLGDLAGCGDDGGIELRGLGDAHDTEGPRHGRNGGEILCEQKAEGLGDSSSLRSFWNSYDICHFTGVDAGKTRRIEPGASPLAHGLPERMGLLRGYGNAIVPQVAAEFIQAALEAIGER